MSVQLFFALISDIQFRQWTYRHHIISYICLKDLSCKYRCSSLFAMCKCILFIIHSERKYNNKKVLLDCNTNMWRGKWLTMFWYNILIKLSLIITTQKNWLILCDIDAQHDKWNYHIVMIYSKQAAKDLKIAKINANWVQSNWKLYDINLHEIFWVPPKP